MRSLPAAEPAHRLHLVFHLDDQSYGLPVAVVREIIPLVEITPIPAAPPLVKGVINLRGSIVPIVHLRRKLDLPDRAPDRRTCLVVADFTGGSWGFLADRVTDCAEIEKIPPADRTDEIARAAEGRLLRGAGQYNGRLVLLLDPDRLLSEADRRALQAL